MLRRLILFFAASLLSLVSYSQFKFYPLRSNKVITNFLATHPSYKWNQPKQLNKTSFIDTLDLPFFDDFSQSFMYPDSSRWQDNLVYVNYDLAVDPPSIGVATFDNLNSKGNPYFGLNDAVTSKSDTLTSQFINLKVYYSSSIPVDYLLTDSVYLSFFYQAQGKSSDKLDPSDSLVLEFKRSDGSWKRVWRTPGRQLAPFLMAYVLVTDSVHLFETFQFRFINYAKNTGFSNMWHLDYVRMDRNGRIKQARVVQDVAISSKPTSLLKDYYSMPWNQFKANASSEYAPKHSFRIMNNDTVAANIRLQFSAYNRAGTLLHQDLFVNHTSFIRKQEDTIYEFNNFAFDTLSEPVIIRKTYQVENAANNKEPVNDIFTLNQVFDNYMAYDDGTAEDGMGLDYGSLPTNSTGKVALGFKLNMADTLRGIMVYFNQSQNDVSMKNLSMMVWQSVDLNNGPSEVLLREIPMEHPMYTDSINGFYLLEMDTPVVLPAGTFYIGWKQTSKYILNIGLDRNYLEGQVFNDHLYYNIVGIWEKAELKGAPMIRPVLGKELPDKLGVSKVKAQAATVNVYPNPASTGIRVLSAERYSSYSIIDLSGREIKSGPMQDDHISLDGMESGMYLLKLYTRQGNAATAKFIVNP